MAADLSGAAPHLYELFGLTVASDIPLPELFAAEPQGEADVRITRGHVAAPNPGSRAVWGLTGDREEAVLTVDGTGRYAIRAGSSIVVDPLEAATEKSVLLFLLGSAFGALLHQRGLLPLHANAIEIGGGAVAFTGRSGAGKSTMANAFLERGYRLLADDVCAVKFDSAGEPMAQPGLPRLRLWRDAAEAFGRRVEDLELAFEGHEKFVVPIHDRQTRRPVPLKRLYLLSELAAGQRGQRIRRLTGSAAVQAILANTYRGQYLSLLGGSEQLLGNAVRLLRTVPVFKVERQWGYDVMRAQIEAIEAHATCADAEEPAG